MPPSEASILSSAAATTCSWQLELFVLFNSVGASRLQDASPTAPGAPALAMGNATQNQGVELLHLYSDAF